MTSMTLELSSLGVSSSEPGKRISLVLTIVMHFLLAIFLIYGVSWQTKMPSAVQVELVRAVSPAPTSESAPAPVPPPPVEAPKIEPRPEPPPLPKAEAKTPAKPDIAIKEKPKPKPEETLPPKPDKMKEALWREVEQLERSKMLSELDKEVAQVKAGKAAAVNAQAIDKWLAQIRDKVRGHIVLPPDVKGNPEATFKVIQLPSGEIIGATLTKSSGHSALDAAIERAILKSSPLPKPEKSELFVRELELRFRPLENA